jgi:prolyl-tRNA editing enzyme YbaK/EbsC (Cys-tRNA(Pro) deacylase)
MHRNAELVQQLLAERGCTGRVVELAASTRTAAEAAAAVGTSLAQIVKSLVFVAGETPILLLVSGSNRVDTGRVAAHLGAPLRRADPELVKQWTGFPIGGTPPLGHRRPLRTLIDRDLLAGGELWAAAGTPHAVFPTTPSELVDLAAGEVIDLKE